MDKAEARVIQKLERYDLRCKPFSKHERRLRKTPHFRVYRDDELAFFCAVKGIAEERRLGGERSEPIFNRITDDIHSAATQFHSVNPDLEYPNVLAFVNDDRMCGLGDFVGVLTGHLLLEGEQAALIYPQYSKGRIRGEKNRIHLYLWFDSYKADKVIFNSAGTRHLDRLCSYFGIDPKSVKSILAGRRRLWEGEK